MKLSAPVYILKQRAKVLSRKRGIPLHEALDQIANQSGFRTWSLLSAKVSFDRPAMKLLSQLRAGDLVLVGSRPGHGKTILGLGVAVQAMRNGSRAALFTLYCTKSNVSALFGVMGEDIREFLDRFLIDDSDQICAGYIAERLSSAPANTLVVIDYLQILDQNRENPDLIHQVRQIKRLARENQLIVLCLSQIDRSYDPAVREFPDMRDVRLPNPMDLKLFDMACFVDRGKMQVAALR